MSGSNGNGHGASLASVMEAYRSGVLERARCVPPLTKRQLEIAQALSSGESTQGLCQRLGLQYTTIVYHINAACNRIPGDLVGATKLIVWYRGATHAVLGSWRATPSK